MGGLIAAVLGFKWLFIATFVISLFSLIPLFLSFDLRDKFKFKPSQGFAYFIRRPKLLIADMLDNIGGEAEGIIWPIFVFLIAQDTLSVGYVGTLIALGSFIFTVFVGKMSDKHDEKKLIRLAVPFLLLIWLLRTQISGIFFMYISSLVAGSLLALFAVPYTRMLYAEAKRDRNESFFIIKEVPTVIGRLIILGLFFLFANHITWLFPIAGVAYLYFLFL